MSGGTRLRAAILGCGGIAERHAAALLTLGQEVELVALCDRNDWKARAFSERFTGGRARVYTHHHALLDEEALDLLLVCLPPYGHTDEVERAAERGVHLFVEKPIALHAEEAWRMVRVAEGAGIKTQVGFMFRFGTAVEELRHLLLTGEAGEIGMFNARYFCNALHAPWWRDREKSGGQLVEQAIHLFDLLRFLMGEPISVYSRQTNFFHRDTPGYTAEDTSATVLNFPGGALGVVTATNGAIPGRWIKEFQVVTQHLTADFTDHSHATFHHTSRPDVPTRTIEARGDVFVSQLQDLIHAIRTDGETRTPLREGAKTLDLVLAARRSAQEGREVAL